MKLVKILLVLLALVLALQAIPLAKASNPYSIKILATCYFAPHWSDQGAYRIVSKNGQRLGNFVALNFLPGGSIVMIPALFKTTKLEVADTLAGKGVGAFKGKKYWKVDILCDEKEWIDDFDFPLELIIVKINKNGPMRDRIVRRNYQLFLNNVNLNDLKH